MKKVILLSKENCQGCNSLKLFLMAALRNEYDDHIEGIKLEDNGEEYSKWVERVETTQMPTLILLEDNEVKDVVRGFNPPLIKALFEDNFN